MPLTDAKVRQATPRAKSYTLRDSGGLLLFVATSGAKHWHFRFSLKGKRARISLGSYPLVGLRQARLLRDEARVQLAQGVDPRSDRAARRRNGKDDDGTFAALAERWCSASEIANLFHCEQKIVLDRQHGERHTRNHCL